MPKKTKQPKCGKVTSITISRLYNLGNYQNIRFDVSAQLGAGESADATFRNLFWILKTLRPVRVPDCKRSFDEAVKLPEESQSEYQKAHINEWRDEIATFNTHQAQKAEAVRLLDDLSGASKYTDHKQKWEDDDTLF